MPYWKLDSVKVGKGAVEVQCFAHDVLAKTLGLRTPLARALFASLCGNDFVPASSLVGLHSRLLGLPRASKPDKPRVIVAVARAVCALVFSADGGASTGEDDGVVAISAGLDALRLNEGGEGGGGDVDDVLTRALDQLFPSSSSDGGGQEGPATAAGQARAGQRAKRRATLAASIACYDTVGSDDVFAAKAVRGGVPLALLTQHRLGELPDSAVDVLLSRRIDEGKLGLEEAALHPAGRAGAAGGGGERVREVRDDILAPLTRRVLALILASAAAGSSAQSPASARASEEERAADPWGRPYIGAADRARKIHVLTSEESPPAARRRQAGDFRWRVFDLDPTPAIAGGLLCTRDAAAQMAALHSLLHCDGDASYVADVLAALAASRCAALRALCDERARLCDAAALVALALRYAAAQGALSRTEAVALLVHSLWCLTHPGVRPAPLPMVWRKKKRAGGAQAPVARGKKPTSPHAGIDARTVHVISLWTALCGKASLANALVGAPLRRDALNRWNWFDGRLCSTTLRLAAQQLRDGGGGGGGGGSRSPAQLMRMVGGGAGGGASRAPRSVGTVVNVVVRR